MDVLTLAVLIITRLISEIIIVVPMIKHDYDCVLELNWEGRVTAGVN